MLELDCLRGTSAGVLNSFKGRINKIRLTAYLRNFTEWKEIDHRNNNFIFFLYDSNYAILLFLSTLSGKMWQLSEEAKVIDSVT